MWTSCLSDARDGCFHAELTSALLLRSLLRCHLLPSDTHTHTQHLRPSHPPACQSTWACASEIVCLFLQLLPPPHIWALCMIRAILGDANELNITLPIASRAQRQHYSSYEPFKWNCIIFITIKHLCMWPVLYFQAVWCSKKEFCVCNFSLSSQGLNIIFNVALALLKVMHLTIQIVQKNLGNSQLWFIGWKG